MSGRVVGAKQSAFAHRQDRLPGVVTKSAAIRFFWIEYDVDAFLLIILDQVGLNANPVGTRQHYDTEHYCGEDKTHSYRRQKKHHDQNRKVREHLADVGFEEN